MRLLFLTNFYPPASRGGYELWCQEVAEHLGQSGHEIVVLTSRSAAPDAGREGVRVVRELYLEMEIDSARNVPLFFLDRRRRERANLQWAQRWMDALAPDFVVIWGMWNLNRSLPALAERRFPQRTVYYFGDYWPRLPSQWRNFWDAPARGPLARAGKWLLKPAADWLLERETRLTLAFPHALFPSQFMRQSYQRAGIVVGQSRVVLGGVPTESYREEARSAATPAAGLRILVGGRLVAEKGIHTAVEALALLAGRPEGEHRLTIVGTGDPSYTSKLRDLAHRLGVANRVHFAGAVPPHSMRQILYAHDVFVFPSIWDEPFGRVLVEAMAAGLPVVGTTVGGAGEILRNGETGLTFAAGNARALADQLDRLAASPDLRERLARQGRRSALAQFDVKRMASEIEAYLMEASAASQSNSAQEPDRYSLRTSPAVVPL